jgi:predicted Zn-dependent protease
MLIVGALAVFVVERFQKSGRTAATRAPLALAALVLALGVWKSATRTRVWRDNETLFNQAVVDSPLSYRAHYMLGAWDFEQKRQRLGEAEYRRALALFPYDPFLAFGLAEQYRTKGMCGPAVPLYQWSRGLDPDFPMGRTGLASCLLETGKYPEAKAVAYDAMRVGGDLKLLRRMVFIADSASAAAKANPAPAAAQARQAGKTREVPQNTAGDDSVRDAEPVRKSL